jgi:hypothetical protein
MEKPESKRTDEENARIVDHIFKSYQSLFERTGQWLLYAIGSAIALGLSGLFVHNKDLIPAKGKIGICLIILIGAALLTAFKRRFEWIFGIGQIAAGLVSCWLSMDGFASAGVTHYQAILFLGGSIYLLREGIETLWDGVAEASEAKNKPANKQTTTQGTT